jgi:hypothetical protein
MRAAEGKTLAQWYGRKAPAQVEEDRRKEREQPRKS